jgi:hypothetical protein
LAFLGGGSLNPELNPKAGNGGVCQWQGVFDWQFLFAFPNKGSRGPGGGGVEEKGLGGLRASSRGGVRPVCIEVGCGLGEWVVERAGLDDGLSSWVGVELRYDRAFASYLRAALAGYAVVGCGGGFGDARACVRMCVRACVRERVRERERGKRGGRGRIESERASERASERGCVCAAHVRTCSRHRGNHAPHFHTALTHRSPLIVVQGDAISVLRERVRAASVSLIVLSYPGIYIYIYIYIYI